MSSESEENYRALRTDRETAPNEEKESSDRNDDHALSLDERRLSDSSSGFVSDSSSSFSSSSSSSFDPDTTLFTTVVVDDTLENGLVDKYKMSSGFFDWQFDVEEKLTKPTNQLLSVKHARNRRPTARNYKRHKNEERIDLVKIKNAYAENEEDRRGIGLKISWRSLSFHVKFVFLIFLGVLSAASAFIVMEGQGVLWEARNYFFRLADSTFSRLLIWTLISLLLTLASFIMTKFFAPTAAGSGIPEVKTILAGTKLSECLSLKTLIVKIIGLTLAKGGGLIIGVVGPFVHISCAIAEQIKKIPWLFSPIKKSEILSQQLLTASCAVGMAAILGCPIGALLFSVEVTTLFFHVRNYWFGAFGAVVGSVSSRFFINLVSKKRVLSPFVDSTYINADQNINSVLWACVLGVICGFLAVLFIRMNSFLVRLQKTMMIRFAIPTMSDFFQKQLSQRKRREDILLGKKMGNYSETSSDNETELNEILNTIEDDVNPIIEKNDNTRSGKKTRKEVRKSLEDEREDSTYSFAYVRDEIGHTIEDDVSTSLCDPRRRFIRFLHRLKVNTWLVQCIFVILITIATAVLTFPEFFGDFMTLKNFDLYGDLFSDTDLTDPKLHHAQDWGKFGSPIFALLICLLLRIVLTSLSITLPIPAGVFSPTVSLGAVFGRLCGEFICLFIDHDCNPSGISMICAMAFNGAITHAFSAAVVICELAGNIDHMMNGVIAVFISILICKLFSVSIYESLQIDKGLPYLPNIEYPVHSLPCEKVMEPLAPKSMACTKKISMATLLRILQNYSPEYSHVPVVTDYKRMFYLGAVSRARLEAIYRRYCEKRGDKRFKLMPGDDQVKENIPFETFSCVSAQTALFYAFSQMISFRTDLVFISDGGRLVGLITKKEIKLAAKKNRSLL